MVKITTSSGGLLGQDVIDSLKGKTQKEIDEIIEAEYEPGEIEIFETIISDNGKEKILKSGNPNEKIFEKIYRPFNEETDVVLGEGDQAIVSGQGIALFEKGKQLPVFTLNFKGEINEYA